MKLIGNIQHIKSKRDSNLRNIELHLERVEYVTNRKDGKYLQPFNFIDELATPLVITGDCLARIQDKGLQDGEFDFNVYDKVGDEYVLHEGKLLSILLVYDEEANQHILSSIEYTVTVSNEEFKQLKAERSKENKQKKGRR